MEAEREVGRKPGCLRHRPQDSHLVVILRYDSTTVIELDLKAADSEIVLLETGNRRAVEWNMADVSLLLAGDDRSIICDDADGLWIPEQGDVLSDPLSRSVQIAVSENQAPDDVFPFDEIVNVPQSDYWVRESGSAEGSEWLVLWDILLGVESHGLDSIDE